MNSPVGYISLFDVSVCHFALRFSGAQYRRRFHGIYTDYGSETLSKTKANHPPNIKG